MATPLASAAAETDPANPLAASAEPQHPGTQSTIENTPRDPIDYAFKENHQAPDASQTQSQTQENTAPREWGPVTVEEPELPAISKSASESRTSVTAGRTEIPDSEEAMDYSPVTLSQIARLDALRAPQSSPTNAGLRANVPEIDFEHAEDEDVLIDAIDDHEHATSSRLVSSVGAVAVPSETLTRGEGGEATTASTFPDMAIRSSQSGMESLDVTAERAMKALKGSTVMPSDAEAEAGPAIGGTSRNAPHLSHPRPSPRTEIPDSDDESSEDMEIGAQAVVGQLSGGETTGSGLAGVQSGLKTTDEVFNKSTQYPPKKSTAANGYDSTQDETQSQSVQKAQDLGVISNGDESTQDETQAQSWPHAQNTGVTSNRNDSTQSGSEEWSHAQKFAETNEYENTQYRCEPQSLKSWPTVSAPPSAQPHLPDEVDDRTPGSTRGPTPMEIDEPVTLPSQSFHTQDTQVLNSQEMEERIRYVRNKTTTGGEYQSSDDTDNDLQSSVDDPSQGPTENRLRLALQYSASADTDGQDEQLPTGQALSTRYGLGNKTEIKDSQDTQSSGFTDQESSNSPNPSYSNLPGAQPVQPPVLPDTQALQPPTLLAPQPISPNIPPPAVSLKRSAPVDVDEKGEDLAEAEHPSKRYAIGNKTEIKDSQSFSTDEDSF